MPPIERRRPEAMLNRGHSDDSVRVDGHRSAANSRDAGRPAARPVDRSTPSGDNRNTRRSRSRERHSRRSRSRDRSNTHRLRSPGHRPSALRQNGSRSPGCNTSSGHASRYARERPPGKDSRAEERPPQQSHRHRDRPPSSDSRPDPQLSVQQKYEQRDLREVISRRRSAHSSIAVREKPVVARELQLPGKLLVFNPSFNYPHV